MIDITLLKRMPPPSHPVEIVSERDWDLYELVTGIVFPDDYKVFLSIYGTGLVGGIITPYNPFCRRTSWKPSYTCRDWMRQLLGIQSFKHRFGSDTFPYPLYPEAGGVLPWGGTDNGDQLFWITEGAPKDWPILIQEVRSSNFQEFQYSMTGFLGAWITGEITCEIIPYDAIDQELLFEPF